MKYRIVPCLLLAALPIGALDLQAATPPAAATPDYSKGFERMFALGLPDVSTGRYATIILHGNVRGVNVHWQQSLGMKGSGWILAESTNGPSLAVVGQAAVLPLWRHDVLARIRREEAKANKPPAAAASLRARQLLMSEDGRLAAQWKATDFTNDLARLLDLLEEKPAAAKSESEDEDVDDPFGGRSISLRRNIKQYQAPAFLLAAHTWKCGFTNEANRIAAGLFAMSGDPRQVILAAYNELADQQYGQIYTTFLTDHDWQGLHSGLTLLLQRYPQGWKKQPAIQILSSNVTARLSGTPPDIAGEGLTDEDRALARELADLTMSQGAALSRLSYSAASLWTLSTSTEAGTNVLQKIVRRGVRSFPLLAALLDDSYLLPADRESFGGQRYGRMRFDRDDPDARANALFHQLQRPVSRGEIAMTLLLPVLLTGGENSYEVAQKSTDELRSIAAESAARLQGKTSIELARIYFAGGTREQKQVAATYLLRSKDARDIQVVEALLSDSSTLGVNGQLLNIYVNERGQAARPLILALASELGVQEKPTGRQPDADGEVEKDTEDEEQPTRPEDYQKRQIEQFLALVSDEPLTNILAEIVDGKRDAVDPSGLLSRRLSQGDAQEALSALLSASLRATNETTRMMLVGYSMHIRSRSQRQFIDPFSETGPQKEIKFDLARNRDQWVELLKDNRYVAQGSAASTVAETAAVAIEHLYAEDKEAEAVEEMEVLDEDEELSEDLMASYQDMQYAYTMAYMRNPSANRLMQAAGRRGREFIVSRARARLEGGSIPPYPNGRLAPERKSELLKQLEESTTLPAEFSKLPLNDLLWLGGALARQTNLNARLAPHALRVVEFSAPPTDAAAQKLAAKWKDGMLNRSLMEDLVAYATERLKAGDATLITVYRQPAFDGTAVRIEPVAAARRGSMSQFLPYIASTVGTDQAAVLANFERVNAVWPLEATPEPKTDTAGQSEVDMLLAEAVREAAAGLGKSGEKQRERFWKAIDELPGGHAASGRTIFLMGTKPGTFTKKELRRYGGYQ